LWGILRTTVGGGLAGLIVFVLFWVSDGRKEVFQFWTSWPFWCASYVSGALLATREILKARKLDVYGKDLIKRFTDCTPEKKLEAEIEIEHRYHIGLMPHWDWQEIIYTITNLGETPIRTKHFHIGRIGGSEKLRFFADIMRIGITAKVAGTRIPVIPFKMQEERLDILICLDSEIKKGQTEQIRITVPKRAGLWDALRTKGSDNGSYTIAQTPPKKLSISIIPPPGYSQDIKLVPQGNIGSIDEEEHTWIIGSLKPADVCKYRVEWDRCPGWIQRWFKSTAIGLGLGSRE
jgi:hypothetical protein